MLYDFQCSSESAAIGLVDNLRYYTLYLAKAAVDTSVDPMDWWRQNQIHLPKWSSALQKVLLIQPSSAASERVFSLLNSSFSEQQERALQDYVETSLMLQFNKH